MQRANSLPLDMGGLGGKAPFFNAAGTGAMSDPNYVLGATRNSEQGTVFLIENLRFSELLQFGDLVQLEPSMNGSTTQIDMY